MQRKTMRSAAALAFAIPFGSACSAGGTAPPPSGTSTVGTGGALASETGGAENTGGGGGTGAAPSTGAGGSSGAHDPTLFSWPEATPDGSTNQLCKAGHYVGTYSCNVTGPNGFGTDGGAYPLTGP